MATKPNRALKYGDQPIRITTVQVIEKLGGAATIKQVDAYLRGLYPHYRDNTRSNLVINTVVIPPFLAEVISRIRSCVEYAASVCSHSTPYSDVRYYKTIATEWHSSAIHPVM